MASPSGDAGSSVDAAACSRAWRLRHGDVDHLQRIAVMSTPIPIVIDTDIGSDPDDALALCLALASPEVESTV